MSTGSGTAIVYGFITYAFESRWNNIRTRYHFPGSEEALGGNLYEVEVGRHISAN